MTQSTNALNAVSHPQKSPKIKIVYWSDIACPFCYIAEKRLQTAIQQMNIQDEVEWEMKSFELDPTAPQKPSGHTIDRFMKKYHLTRPEAQERIDYISSLGKDLGIDFRYSSTQYTNTFNAHRLVKLVSAKGNSTSTDKLVELLYDAYFTKSLDVNSLDTLVSLAAQVGVSRGEVEQLLSGSEYAKEVRKDEEDATRRNIHGVPYILFNGKHPINGAASISGFKTALREAMA